MDRNLCEDASLVKKGLLGDLDEKECEELNELLENPQLNKVYGQLKDPDFLKKEFRAYDRYSAGEGYRRFLKEIGGGKRSVRLMRLMAGVAALLVLALGVAMWKYVYFSPQPVDSVLSVGIPAGESKAKLILGDGRIVPIARQELFLQEQDGSQIEYKGGNLSYRPQKGKVELVYNVLDVPRGGECALTLEDGTKVWINAGTKLKYPVVFTGDKREVFLEGEAYFDVVHGERPFVVNTSFGDVKVLGTAFGVTAYPGEKYCYTTLERGRVSFQAPGWEPMEMVPGEQIVASGTGIMEKRTVNAEEYVGWRYGLYVFKEKPLKDIMETLARWYDITVEFQSEELGDILFTGNLERYDRINIFLNALVRTGNVHYMIEGKRVFLSK